MTTLARVVGAVGFTGFIGWYAVDFAQTRGSTTVEFAAWSWLALLGWLVVVVGILGVHPDLGVEGRPAAAEGRRRA
jgi:hypothetical protein